MTIYIIEDAKSGQLLARGNAKECAAALGFASVNSFRHAVYQVRDGLDKRYRIKTNDILEKEECVKDSWYDEFSARWRRMQKRFGV